MPSSVVQLSKATAEKISQSTVQRLPTELPQDQTVSQPVVPLKSLVAGGVALHLDVWVNSTTDRWVLEVVPRISLKTFNTNHFNGYWQ